MKKHRGEINKWADAPEGTKVWGRRTYGTAWTLEDYPRWHPDYFYIVDDWHPEVRKQYLDDPRKIEIDISENDEPEKWVQCSFETLSKLDGFLWSHTSDYYRIRTDTVTKWKWVVYEFLTDSYRVLDEYHTKEEAISSKYMRFVCKIEETALEEER